MRTTLTRTLIARLTIVACCPRRDDGVMAVAGCAIIPSPNRLLRRVGIRTRPGHACRPDNKSADDRFAAQELHRRLKADRRRDIEDWWQGDSEILIGLIHRPKIQPSAEGTQRRCWRSNIRTTKDIF